MNFLDIPGTRTDKACGLMVSTADCHLCDTLCMDSRSYRDANAKMLFSSVLV